MLADPHRPDDIPLLFVQLNRLLARRCGPLGVACELENLGEIGGTVLSVAPNSL